MELSPCVLYCIVLVHKSINNTIPHFYRSFCCCTIHIVDGRGFPMLLSVKHFLLMFMSCIPWNTGPFLFPDKTSPCLLFNPVLLHKQILHNVKNFINGSLLHISDV